MAVLASLTRALSAMTGNKKDEKSAVSLVGYREAKVFRNDGDNTTGRRLAAICYVKQLVLFSGCYSIENSLDVDVIMTTFHSDNKFSHLHNKINLNASGEDLEDILIMLEEELGRYATVEEYKYEPWQLGIWRNELYERIVDGTANYVSSSMGDFLRIYKLNDFTGCLGIGTKVQECTGYSWLGYEVALAYGFNPDKSYSKIFLEWCKRIKSTDIEKSLQRIYKEHPWVTDDHDIDALIAKNLV